MPDRMKLDTPAYHQSLKAAEEIKRLREELAAAHAERDEWRAKYEALEDALLPDIDAALAGVARNESNK